MSAIAHPFRAIVTGASSGIGAVYADRLAARGLPLLLVARRADRLEALATRLRASYGTDVQVLPVDLESAAQTEALEARMAVEPISMLVNNAGAGGLGPVAAATPAQLERTIRLNVVALTRLSHAALASFRKQGAGTLVNIASVMAYAPSPNGAVYSGSKAYVLNFTRSLQMEYAGTGIRMQVVMPGPIRTEFFSSQGLSDTVFPDNAFLTAEDLVDAALAGLDHGEAVTTPSVGDLRIWETLEAARNAFMGASVSGVVAPRYLQHETSRSTRP